MRPTSIRLLLALMTGLLSLSLFSASSARSASGSTTILMPSIVYTHATLRVTMDRLDAFFENVVLGGEIINYGDTTVYGARVPLGLEFAGTTETDEAYGRLRAIAPGQRVPFAITIVQTNARGFLRNFVVYDVVTNLTPLFATRPITVVSDEVGIGIPGLRVFGEIRNDQPQQLDVSVVATFYDASNNFIDFASTRIEDVPAGATVSYEATSMRLQGYHHYVVQAQGYTQ
jgi:hypothetical protein